MRLDIACRDINELTPKAQEACKLFLAECKKRNIPIFITETYRSQERQNWLYGQGRTRPGIKVTWTRNSNHKGRLAWDCAVNPPKNLYDKAVLAKAGKVAAELGIEWGGTWSDNYDGPHFQINKNWVKPKGGHKVQKTNIELNGVIKEVDTVNIEGHNYIKLQDLRDDKIVVDYDAIGKLPIVRVK